MNDGYSSRFDARGQHRGRKGSSAGSNEDIYNSKITSDHSPFALLALPDDILVMILEYCRPRDHDACTLVCARLLALERSFFRQHLERRRKVYEAPFRRLPGNHLMIDRFEDLLLWLWEEAPLSEPQQLEYITRLAWCERPDYPAPSEDKHLGVAFIRRSHRSILRGLEVDPNRLKRSRWDVNPQQHLDRLKGSRLDADEITWHPPLLTAIVMLACTEITSLIIAPPSKSWHNLPWPLVDADGCGLTEVITRYKPGEVFPHLRSLLIVTRTRYKNPEPSQIIPLLVLPNLKSLMLQVVRDPENIWMPPVERPILTESMVDDALRRLEVGREFTLTQLSLIRTTWSCEGWEYLLKHLPCLRDFFWIDDQGIRLSGERLSGDWEDDTFDELNDVAHKEAVQYHQQGHTRGPHQQCREVSDSPNGLDGFVYYSQAELDDSFEPAKLSASLSSTHADKLRGLVLLLRDHHLPTNDLGLRQRVRDLVPFKNLTYLAIGTNVVSPGIWRQDDPIILDQHLPFENLQYLLLRVYPEDTRENIHFLVHCLLDHRREKFRNLREIKLVFGHNTSADDFESLLAKLDQDAHAHGVSFSFAILKGSDSVEKHVFEWSVVEDLPLFVDWTSNVRG